MRTLYAENANCMTETCDCPYMRDFDRPLPAGVTVCSLWSAEDGVVDPQLCIRDDEKNVQISGTHVGMVANRDALGAIAKILAHAA